MQDLKVAVIQADLEWEKPVENRAYFEALFVELVGQNIDLVVLPEMFTTGFSMSPASLAEQTQDTTIQWMQNNATTYNFLLTGSLIIEDNGGYYNRQIFAFPNGEIRHYDKRHLFRMGNEHLEYTAGTERIVLNYKGWRILPQICYDLRFPVWSRNHNDYDVAIYIANFPTPRRAVWNTLLAARAIENQSYVIGCNRIGTDGYDLHYSGDSQILSPKGEVLSKATEQNAEILVQSLSLSALQNFRTQFPAHLDGDSFEVHV